MMCLSLLAMSTLVLRENVMHIRRALTATALGVLLGATSAAAAPPEKKPAPSGALKFPAKTRKPAVTTQPVSDQAYQDQSGAAREARRSPFNSGTPATQPADTQQAAPVLRF